MNYKIVELCSSHAGDGHGFRLAADGIKVQKFNLEEARKELSRLRREHEERRKAFLDAFQKFEKARFGDPGLKWHGPPEENLRQYYICLDE